MLETLFRHLDMVKLSVGAVVMLTLVNCVGLIDGGSGGGGGDGLTPEQREARSNWQTQALPVFRQACLVCHNGSRPGVGFLAGDATDDFALHDKLVAFDPPVVNLEAPSSSRVLQKGLHDGPMLNPDQSYAILSWIQAEKSAQATAPSTGSGSSGAQAQLLTIPAFAVMICDAATPAASCPVNHVAMSTLGDAGAAVPGAEITFVAQKLGTGSLYLNNLSMVGGTAGVYLEHPLFVSRPATGDPVPDGIDRYFNLKLDVAAGKTVQIDGGTASFVGFDPTSMLEIHFKTVTAFKPDAAPGGGGGATGGCKALAMFKTNVVPALKLAGAGNVNCSSCHVNGSGKGAMDITGYDSADDATVLNACNQVKTRVDLTTTNQSGIYLAPDPASGTNHPQKFASADQFTTSFKTMVDRWVQAEKTAP
jgi:hypothetical protein